MASKSRPVGLYCTAHDILLIAADMQASGVSNRSRYVSLLVNLVATVGGLTALEALTKSNKAQGNKK